MTGAAHTPAVSIRPLARSRVAELLALFKRNHAGVEEYDEAAQRQRLERKLGEIETGAGHYWTIHLGSTMVGDIGFNQLHRGTMQTANVGYMVDASVRGRGVASEALRLVIRESFETLRLHRLDAGALVTNRASQRVLEKAGFRRVGLLERHFYEDGEWRDHLWYELIGPDDPPQPAP